MMCVNKTLSTMKFDSVYSLCLMFLLNGNYESLCRKKYSVKQQIILDPEISNYFYFNIGIITFDDQVVD